MLHRFETPHKMQNHSDFFSIPIQADHEGKGFKCDICPLTLKNYSQLQKHKILEHCTDKKYECKFCGKRIGSVPEVERHERRHQEPQFQCSICAKGLKSENALVAHERSHKGEKPFECSTCGAGFSGPSSLRQHERGVHKIVGPRGGKPGWSGKKKSCEDGNE